MKLPKGNYKWLDMNQISCMKTFIDKIDEEGDKGYLFCVDLLYPENLHEKHSLFPLAPHTVQIQYKDLSPYAKKVLLQNGGNKSFKCEKLIASFLPKKNYVLHIKNLKLYLKLGLKIQKVHKVLEFSQEAFLKPYIKLCTEKRQMATNTFEKNLYKLMCNSGKKFYFVHKKIFS